MKKEKGGMEMKDRVSFEGIGEVMATFYAGEGVKGGQVVKLGGAVWR